MTDIQDEHNKQNGTTEQDCVMHEHSATAKELMGLPLVADTVSYIGNTKYGNTAMKFTSSAVNTVSEQFHDQIGIVDNLAASSIKYFGEKFPIVRKPTNEVLDKVKTPAIITITTVRQYQETFGTTIDNKLTTPTRTIFNQRVAVPGMNMARSLDASLTNVVDKLESAVFTWLPDEDPSDTPKSVHDSASSNGDTIQTFRALTLADVGRQRLTRKFKSKLRHTFNRTTYNQLQESNVLLKQATETVANLNQLLQGMVLNVRDTVQSPEGSFNFQSRLHDLTTLLLGDSSNREDLQKTVQTRMVELSHALVSTTDSISAYIAQNSQNFPEALQIRLHPLVNFFEKRYADVVNEIRNGEGTPTEKARNIVKLTTQHTLPLLQSSLSDFQELMQFYKSTLETSVNNTAERVKSTVGMTSEVN